MTTPGHRAGGDPHTHSQRAGSQGSGSRAAPVPGSAAGSGRCGRRVARLPALVAGAVCATLWVLTGPAAGRAKAEILPPALVGPAPAVDGLALQHAPQLGALELGHVRSPVVQRLRREMGERLRIRTVGVAQAATIDPRRYRLVIVDGDSISARELGRSVALRRFAAAGDWTLAVDTSDADERALRLDAGFAAVPARRHHDAASGRQAMYLFTRGRVAGTERVFTLDVPTVGPAGPGRLSRAERRRATDAGTTRAVTLLRNAVLAGSGVVRAQAAARDDNAIPPEVQHVGYTFDEVGPEGGFQLPAGYWNAGRGRTDLIGVPAPGQQAATWTISQNFDVYLDNARNPQGNFQVVAYDVKGQFNPAPGDIYYEMNNPFQIGFTNDKILERAWWTGAIEPSMRPLDPGRLIWQANAPETPNEETQYSSGNDFGVSFSTDGPSATYSVNNSESHAIPDWGVQSKTSGSSLGWTFTARHPCDVRAQISNQNGCFEGAVPGLPARPNPLSLGQIQFSASGRWKTTRLLTGSDGVLQFLGGAPITVVDTYCQHWILAACTPGRIGQPLSTLGQLPDIFVIDAGAVDPVPVASLTLAPNPANGAKREPVTGTVKLTRPAPMDVSVIVSSNSANAIVGSPLGGGSGSSRVVVIDQGNTSATFPIQTNDNGLGNGHTTAAITAFYTEPTVTQLQIGP
jgi:hypothetical protein